MANVYTEFLQLIPERKQYIGKILTVDQQLQMSRVELIDGRETTVMGTGTAGETYLIQDGRLTQRLPSLSVYDVVVY